MLDCQIVLFFCHFVNAISTNTKLFQTSCLHHYTTLLQKFQLLVQKIPQLGKKNPNIRGYWGSVIAIVCPFAKHQML